MSVPEYTEGVEVARLVEAPIQNELVTTGP